MNLIKSDVMKFVTRSQGAYNIIFADPPFSFNQYEEMIQAIFNGSILAKKGMLIVEHEKRTNLKMLEGYRETRNFGNVHFSFFYHP